MITEVELTNYRGHTDTKVPLGRFTLLVGDNAVGKTSVLAAVSLVARSLTHDPKELFQNETALEFLRRHGSADATELTVRGASAPADVGWSLAIKIPLEAKVPGVIGYTYTDEQRTVEGGGRAFAHARGGAESFRSNEALLPPPAILRLEPRRLAEPSPVDPLTPMLAEDGSGLATVLKELKATDDVRYKSLVEAARAVVPSLVDLNFQRIQRSVQRSRLMTVDGQRVTVPEQANQTYDELLLKFAHTNWLPAHSASDGTLLTLGLLTRLYAPNAPRMLLIDDIDRALHPRAQGEFIASLRKGLENLPGTQIIATAHSPYLADHFKPDEVVVFSRTSGDTVIARRLSDHPDYRLRDMMTTGEFLTASGPEWFWQ